MSPSHVEKLLPPDDPEAFESLCLDLCEALWQGRSAQKHSRRGQAQAGVDVYGRTSSGWVGVQCKQKNLQLRQWLKPSELKEEARKARTFEPVLERFIVATTGGRDTGVQEEARKLTTDDFEIEVWCWDDIWHGLHGNPKLFERLFPIYWPRQAGAHEQRIASTRLRHSARELFGRESSLARLDHAWQDSETHVLIFVAWGGVGKTSLVAHWAAQLAAESYHGADYFDWSFYSQGTREQGSVSADAFLDAALRFFGDAETADSPLGPWDKGSRLAEKVAERKTLLVLDGLEPLQYPPGPLRGELKDQGLQALLLGLAQRNPGLCVVTTRESVKDLQSFRGSTAPEISLERLSTVAGVELLRSLGVRGKPDELETLVRDVRGHALTLNLLGGFLADAFEGDIRKRDRVDFEQADDEIQGGHAFRVMEAYERWFEGDGEKGQRQLAILRLLGLFDRPASVELLGALRQPPAIPGLTHELVGLDEAGWNLSVKRLATSRLLTSDEGSLDAHPLVREHFARQLQTQQPKAWKSAHGRLFEYLKENTEHQPDTLEGLQPLYQAVVHGCHAGRHKEARAEIYRDRINRGTGHDGFYVTRQLGAFGAELGAVACFFEIPWSQVSARFGEADRAWLLSEAASNLRALGRLREAVEPMRTGLEMAIAQEEWRQAAIRANNLSELGLTLGEVEAAVVDAQQSVDFADRSGDWDQSMARRTTAADALHHAGRRGEALQLFAEAETMQAEKQPSYPLLYSVRGFRYCDLLLTEAERAVMGSGAVDSPEGPDGSPLLEALEAVEARAQKMFEWRVPSDSILSIALDHLSLGRVRLYRSLLDGSALDAAGKEIEQALEVLRRAGQSDELPKGLLTRAWWRWAAGDEDGAQADLDEAEEIARRGAMRLFLADIGLYRARFFGDREALAEAAELVRSCGYGRRLEEVEALERKLSAPP